MIQLTEDLVLVADERCYIVGKPRQRPDKGIIVDSPTYHTNINQAVLSAIRRSMRLSVKDGSVTTLRQFMVEEQRLTEQIKALLAPLEV